MKRCACGETKNIKPFQYGDKKVWRCPDCQRQYRIEAATFADTWQERDKYAFDWRNVFIQDTGDK